jgi:hypothetical protein
LEPPPSSRSFVCFPNLLPGSFRHRLSVQLRIAVAMMTTSTQSDEQISPKNQPKKIAIPGATLSYSGSCATLYWPAATIRSQTQIAPQRIARTLLWSEKARMSGTVIDKIGNIVSNCEPPILLATLLVHRTLGGGSFQRATILPENRSVFVVEATPDADLRCFVVLRRRIDYRSRLPQLRQQAARPHFLPLLGRVLRGVTWQRS